MTGNKKEKKEELNKVFKYKSFTCWIDTLNEIDEFLNNLDKKYEVIGMTNVFGAKSSKGWQFIFVTKYYE